MLAFYLKRLVLAVASILSITPGFSQVPIPDTYPPNGNIYPWGYVVKGTNWDTSPYLPFVYNRIPFRMMLPPGVSYNSATNTFSNPSGEKFPVLLFYHGLGEVGTENGYQLRHGAKPFMDAMNAGKYRGFLIFPQNFTEFWGAGQQEALVEMVNNLVNKGLADPYRLSVSGLSAGGHGVWTSLYFNPKAFASGIPMSSANLTTIEYIPEFVHIPIWESQGGKDTRPSPGTAQALVDAIKEQGGNIRLSLYPDLGHGTWDRMFTEPDFYPFLMRANKINPHVFFGKYEFCQEDTINVRLGVTAGFEDYQWRKDGVLIGGASSNEITVAEIGIYDVRVKRNGEWSYWSPTPVNVRYKPTTITPPITAVGGASNIIPDVNGATSVTLSLPAGYEQYKWKKSGSEEIIGTERILVVNTPGEYVATVTELFGCSSTYSQPFKVISANGAGGPPAAINFSGFAPSQTLVQLQWSENPTPANNETGFEIYRSTTQGGPYSLIYVTGADVTSYQDQSVIENTTYYYVVRAVNNNGASSQTPEVRIKTQVDIESPTAPLNLRVNYTMPNAVSLSWDSSTDNIGVFRYDLYKDGIKVLVTESTTATLFNLTEFQVYNFTVKARDQTGNESPSSNFVTAAAVASGLDYKYYEGTWTTLPNFNGIAAIKSGHVANVDLAPRLKNPGIAFYWEGKIVIPVAGNYTFETRSDDGSKLYIGGYDEANLVVDNDGLHSSQYREGTRYFPLAGTYPIVITYFNGASGTPLMQVYWKNTASGVGSTRQLIPASAFISNFQMPGSAPAPASALTANAVSYDRINLSWTDNSNNENGFQVFRSLATDGTYEPIGTTAANTTTFSDNKVAPNTTYFYKVVAYGQYGQSAINLDVPRGLSYSYYQSSFNSCPPIETATPVKTGAATNFDLSPKGVRATNFAFKWTGKIIIPQTGTYTFYLNADEGGLFYINNQLVISKDGLTPLEKSATITLNQGIYPLKLLYRQRNDAYALTVSWEGPGFGKTVIPNSAFWGPEVNAATHALPPVPNSPSSLETLALTDSSIRLTFNDNSNDEVNFIVYRSTGDNSSYNSVATLPANAAGGTIQYTDVNLFTNVTYYYKVVATNVGGESAPSAEDFAKTLNNAPSLSDLGTKTMRWGTSVDINLFASDVDAETLTLSAVNLPAFAVLSDYGDGSGLLSFLPTQQDTGTYAITVRVDDQNGGYDTKTLTLIVDSNFLPELADLPELRVNEAQTLSVDVSAVDLDGDAITLNAYNLPDFASFIDNGNGTGTMVISPAYGNFGNYFINLEAVDAKGASTNVTARIAVDEVRVNYRLLVNFNGTSVNNAPAPWNNTNQTPLAGAQMTDLNDDTNRATEIDLTFVTPWGPQSGGIGEFGRVTGNNSGIYPDNVLKSYYYASDNNTKTIKFSSLNPDLKYSFVFFGSRMDGSNRITQYTIGTTTVSLECADNTKNTVRIENVSPDVNGEVIIGVRKVGTTQFGYLNAMEVIAFVDDSNAPVPPTAIQAINNTDGSITISWVDNSNSETYFNLYRATNANGPFTLVKKVAPNATTTIDADALLSMQTYYYKISANNYVGGNDSNVISVTTPNRAPVVASIAPQQVAENRTLEITVSATDRENDAITLTASGLPNFVLFTDNGDGTGFLQAAPVFGDRGSYAIQITATDALNQVSAPVVLTLTVEEVPTVKTLVNFNDTRYPVSFPWNSWNTAPNAVGKFISDLKDVNNNNTGITLTLLDVWTGGNVLGEVTGNDSGVFPDNVMRTYYYYNSTAARRIQVSGLQPDKTYNFTFFASSDGAGDKTTIFSIGSATASLNAADNATNTASINGQKSDASGELIINVQKAAASKFAFINAMVIESFEDGGMPLTPTNLVAKSLSRTSIELSWMDNSSNETGFQVYRSSTSAGPWTLINTTSPNVTKYTNAALTPNTKYFYKVRAVNAIGSSDYTSVASATTLDYIVYINFDDGRNGIAPAPWNTTARVPLEGDVWYDLRNDQGLSTGINMTLVQGFSGSNPFGMNTGNNSGIFPDMVMESFYFNEVGIVAQLKFSGLNPTNRYNLVYFTSRNGTGNRNTNFTVNGQVVTLNASFNISNTVQHSGVAPDINGEISVSIQSGEGSVYGYLNAMVIQSYTDNQSGSSAREATPEQVSVQFTNETDPLENVSVYPNPFKDDRIFLALETNEARDLNISVMSSTGVEIFTKDVTIDNQAKTVELDLTSRNLNKGLYLIKVASGKKHKVLKLIRE